MADPLPSGARPPEAFPGAEDDARIEQLLVTGLDHYFAAEFDAAINLWTRVLFLDRTHDRARAYIERARSAQAEQLRVSEALVHEGLAAFDRGEVARARALLSDALARGASHDLALGVLGRIDRLDIGQAASPPAARDLRRRPFARPAPLATVEAEGRSRTLGWAIPMIAVLIASGIGWWELTSVGSTFRSWAGSGPAERPATAALPVEPLPVPAPTEAYLVLGRQLFASGKVRDALVALDRVPLGDSLYSDANRLRGQIQRELLAAAAAVDAASPATASAPEAPRPE